MFQQEKIAAVGHKSGILAQQHSFVSALGKILDPFLIFDTEPQFLRKQGTISSIGFVVYGTERECALGNRKHIIKPKRSDNLTIVSLNEEVIGLLLFKRSHRHVIVHFTHLKHNAA